MCSKFGIHPPRSAYIADVAQWFDKVYNDLLTLIKVKCKGRLHEYVDDFKLAWTQVSLLPEQALSVFLAGLEHETQSDNQDVQPQLYCSCNSTVKLHEASKASISKHDVSNHVPPAKFTNSPPKPHFSIIPLVET